MTPETVLAKFRQAMAICASVRAYSLGEAAKALIAKGWDEATRARAAESTFAKVDESWLVMGQQYREILLQEATKAIQSTAAGSKRQ